jgi:Ca2+-dependent lipid-binding protein
MHREEKKREIRFGPGGYGELKGVSTDILERGKTNIAQHKTSQSVDLFVGAKTKPYLMYDSVLQESSRGKYIGFTVPPRLKSGATRRPYIDPPGGDTPPKSSTKKKRGLAAFSKRWGKAKRGNEQHEVALELDRITQAKKKLRTSTQAKKKLRTSKKKKTPKTSTSLPSLDQFPALHSSNRQQLQPLKPLASSCTWTMPDFENANPLGLLDDEEEKEEEGKYEDFIQNLSCINRCSTEIYAPTLKEYLPSVTQEHADAIINTSVTTEENPENAAAEKREVVPSVWVPMLEHLEQTKFKCMLVSAVVRWHSQAAAMRRAARTKGSAASTIGLFFRRTLARWHGEGAESQGLSLADMTKQKWLASHNPHLMATMKYREDKLAVMRIQNWWRLVLAKASAIRRKYAKADGIEGDPDSKLKRPIPAIKAQLHTLHCRGACLMIVARYESQLIRYAFSVRWRGKIKQDDAAAEAKTTVRSAKQRVLTCEEAARRVGKWVRDGQAVRGARERVKIMRARTEEYQRLHAEKLQREREEEHQTNMSPRERMTRDVMRGTLYLGPDYQRVEHFAAETRLEMVAEQTEAVAAQVLREAQEASCNARARWSWLRDRIPYNCDDEHWFRTHCETELLSRPDNVVVLRRLGALYAELHDEDDYDGATAVPGVMHGTDESTNRLPIAALLLQRAVDRGASDGRGWSGGLYSRTLLRSHIYVWEKAGYHRREDLNLVLARQAFDRAISHVRNFCDPTIIFDGAMVEFRLRQWRRCVERCMQLVCTFSRTWAPEKLAGALVLAAVAHVGSIGSTGGELQCFKGVGGHVAREHQIRQVAEDMRSARGLQNAGANHRLKSGASGWAAAEPLLRKALLLLGSEERVVAARRIQIRYRERMLARHREEQEEKEEDEDEEEEGEDDEGVEYDVGDGDEDEDEEEDEESAAESDEADVETVSRTIVRPPAPLGLRRHELEFMLARSIEKQRQLMDAAEQYERSYKSYREARALHPDDEWCPATLSTTEKEHLRESERCFNRLKWQLQVIRVQGLPQMDSGGLMGGAALNDVYVKVFWNNELIGRTATLHDTLEPAWKHEVFQVQLPLDISTARFRLEVWEHDDMSADDFLGEVLINDEAILKVPFTATKVALRPKPKGEKVKCEHVQGDLWLRQVRCPTAVLTVHGGWGIKPTSRLDENDVYCRIKWDGKLVARTAVKHDTERPSWSEPMERYRLLVPDDMRDAGKDEKGISQASELVVEVWDKDQVGSDDFLGEVRLSGEELEELKSAFAGDGTQLRGRKRGAQLLERGRTTFTLHDRPEKQATPSRGRVRIAQERRHKIMLQLHKAVGLEPTDLMGPGNDVYAKVYVGRRSRKLHRQQQQKERELRELQEKERQRQDERSGSREAVGVDASGASEAAPQQQEQEEGGVTAPAVAQSKLIGEKLVGKSRVMKDAIEPVWTQEIFEILLPRKRAPASRRASATSDTASATAAAAATSAMTKLRMASKHKAAAMMGAGAQPASEPGEVDAGDVGSDAGGDEGEEEEEEDGDDDEFCVRVELWDEDIGTDDFLGELVLTADELLDHASIDGDEARGIITNISTSAVEFVTPLQPKPEWGYSMSSKNKYVIKGVGSAVTLSCPRLLRVKLRVRRADGLTPTDGDVSNGNDVYAKVFWDGRQIGKTAVVKNTITPQWDNELFSWLLYDDGRDLVDHTIRVELWDDDYGKDDFLGEVIVPGMLLRGNTRDPELMMAVHRKPTDAPAPVGLPANKQKHVGGSLSVSWHTSCEVGNGWEEEEEEEEEDEEPLLAPGERVQIYRSMATASGAADDLVGDETKSENTSAEPLLPTLVPQLWGKIQLRVWSVLGLAGHKDSSPAPESAEEVADNSTASREGKAGSSKEGSKNGWLGAALRRKSGDQLSDVYVKVLWMDKEIGRTAVVHNTLAPEWPDEVFELQLPECVMDARLRLEVWDDDFGTDDFLGQILLLGEDVMKVCKLTELLEGKPRQRDDQSARPNAPETDSKAAVPATDSAGGMAGSTSPNQWDEYEYELGKKSQITGTLDLSWAPEQTLEEMHEYKERDLVEELDTLCESEERYERLRKFAVQIHGAGELPATEVGGNDPYCILYWNGRKLGRTSTRYNTLAPTRGGGAHELVEIVMPLDIASSQLRVEVWDWDMGKDDFLGEVTVSGDALFEMDARHHKHSLAPKAGRTLGGHSALSETKGWWHDQLCMAGKVAGGGGSVKTRKKAVAKGKKTKKGQRRGSFYTKKKKGAAGEVAEEAGDGEAGEAADVDADADAAAAADAANVASAAAAGPAAASTADDADATEETEKAEGGGDADANVPSTEPREERTAGGGEHELGWLELSRARRRHVTLQVTGALDLPQEVEGGRRKDADAYVKVFYNERLVHKTTVIMECANPVWESRAFELMLPPQQLSAAQLRLEVWDKDMLGGDDFIGEVRVNGECLLRFPDRNRNYGLLPRLHPLGQVHVSRQKFARMALRVLQGASFPMVKFAGDERTEHVYCVLRQMKNGMKAAKLIAEEREASASGGGDSESRGDIVEEGVEKARTKVIEVRVHDNMIAPEWHLTKGGGHSGDLEFLLPTDSDELDDLDLRVELWSAGAVHMNRRGVVVASDGKDGAKPDSLLGQIRISGEDIMLGPSGMADMIRVQQEEEEAKSHRRGSSRGKRHHKHKKHTHKKRKASVETLVNVVDEEELALAKKLWAVAEAGNLAKVEEYLEDGADPTWKNPERANKTALQIASLKQHTAIAKILISAKPRRAAVAQSTDAGSGGGDDGNEEANDDDGDDDGDDDEADSGGRDPDIRINGEHVIVPAQSGLSISRSEMRGYTMERNMGRLAVTWSVKPPAENQVQVQIHSATALKPTKQVVKASAEDAANAADDGDEAKKEKREEGDAESETAAGRQVDCFVKLYWMGEEVEQTAIIQNNPEPEWEFAVFNLTLPPDAAALMHGGTKKKGKKRGGEKEKERKKYGLRLEVLDANSMPSRLNPLKDPRLGEAFLDLKSLMALPPRPTPQDIQPPSGTNAAKARGETQGLLVLKQIRPQRLLLTIHDAARLRRSDVMSKNDVYCVVHWNGQKIARTAVKHNTLDPMWQHETFAITLPEIDWHEHATSTEGSTVQGDDEKGGEGGTKKQRRHVGEAMASTQLRVVVMDQDVGFDDYLGEVMLRGEELLQPPEGKKEYELVKRPKDPPVLGLCMPRCFRMPITIHSAHGLKKTDTFGANDVYCIVRVNGSEAARTTIVKDTLDPEWGRGQGETVHVLLPMALDEVTIQVEVWDDDGGKGADDFLGEVSIRGNLMRNPSPGVAKMTLKRKAGSKGKAVTVGGAKVSQKHVHGELRWSWAKKLVISGTGNKKAKATEGEGGEDGDDDELMADTPRVLPLMINRALRLPCTDGATGRGKPDPYCKVFFNNELLGKTFTMQNDDEPSWVDSAALFPIPFPGANGDTSLRAWEKGDHSLVLEVWDCDSVGSDDLLGRVAFKGVEIAKLMSEQNQDFEVLNPKSMLGSLLLSRVSYRTGTVRIISASGLKKTDIMGLNDVYCKIFMGDKQVGQTEVMPDTLDPVWGGGRGVEFNFLVPDVSVAVDLKIEVWDQDLDGDDFLGEIVLPNLEIHKLVRKLAQQKPSSHSSSAPSATIAAMQKEAQDDLKRNTTYKSKIALNSGAPVVAGAQKMTADAFLENGKARVALRKQRPVSAEDGKSAPAKPKVSQKSVGGHLTIAMGQLKEAPSDRLQVLSVFFQLHLVY